VRVNSLAWNLGLRYSGVLPASGFVAFVLSLGSRSLYMYQFSQFGYCHMALLVVVGQSTFLAANVFAGFIWYGCAPPHRHVL
jgi:hypothetical protein